MRKIILGFLILASGCGFVFQNINEADHISLSPGMSKEEVISIMGAPQKREENVLIEGKEYDIWVYLIEGQKPKKLGSLSTNYVKILFLDNKLVEWHKDRVFAQPSYKYLEIISPGDSVTASNMTTNEIPKPEQFLK